MVPESPSTKPRLSAKEAAARLGIKRETLYAYVSRGLITRTAGTDGRTSTFDPDEVDRVARRRRGRQGEQITTLFTTSITELTERGVFYRGVEPSRFLDRERPFESVVWWLITGRELDEGDWQPNARAVEAARRISTTLPVEATALDTLRAAVLGAAAADPLRHDLTSPERCAPTVVDAMLAALDTDGRGGPPERIWRSLTDQAPTDASLDCLSTALVVLADHGLAASTFAARVAASARADPYSVVLTGLGPVGGVLHGGSSRLVHELYTSAEAAGSASEAIRAHLQRDPRIPGLGHSVYVERDPRFAVLSEKVGHAYRRSPGLATVLDVYELATNQVHHPPNIDLALGALTFLADMDADAGEAIFAIARTAGWLAHGAEEYQERPLRLRPRASYVGPPTP